MNRNNRRNCLHNRSQVRKLATSRTPRHAADLAVCEEEYDRKSEHASHRIQRQLDRWIDDCRSLPFKAGYSARDIATDWPKPETEFVTPSKVRL